MQKQNTKDVTILLQTSPASSNRSSIVSSNGSNSSGYSSASSNAVKFGSMIQHSESSSPSNIQQHPPPPTLMTHHFLPPHNQNTFDTNQEPHNHYSESNHRQVLTNLSTYTHVQYPSQNFIERFDDDQLTFQIQEVLEWLKSIKMTETFQFFVKSGYDLVTISRMTPEDLTAIGITHPELRKRISNEINKLCIDDTIPNHWPGSLYYWLETLHLLEYLDILTSEGCSTLDRLLQVTWEDFEEMKIHKLGHLKKLVLAIDRLKRSSGIDLSKVVNRNGNDVSSKPPALPYSSIDNYLQLRGTRAYNRDQISSGNNGSGHAIEYVPIHLNRSWSGMLGPQHEDARPSSLLVRYESFHGNPYNDFKSLVRDRDAISDLDSNFSDTTPTNRPISPGFLRESRSSIVPSPAPLTPITHGLPPLPTISPQQSPTKNYDGRPRLPPKPKPKPSLQSGLGARTTQENYNFNVTAQAQYGDLSVPNSPRSNSICNSSISLSPSPKRQTVKGELGVTVRRRNNSGDSNNDRLSTRSQNTPPPPPKRTNSIRENLNVISSEPDNAVSFNRTLALNQNNQQFERNSNLSSANNILENGAATVNGSVNGADSFNRSICSANSATNQNATDQQYISENVINPNSLYSSPNNCKFVREPPLPPPPLLNRAHTQHLNQPGGYLHNGRDANNFYLDQTNQNISNNRDDPNELDLPYPPPPIECCTLPFANENMGTMRQKSINEFAAELPTQLSVSKVLSKPKVPAKPIKQTMTNGPRNEGDVSNIFEDIDDMFAGLTQELNNLIAMQK